MKGWIEKRKKTTSKIEKLVKKRTKIREIRIVLAQGNIRVSRRGRKRERRKRLSD